MSWLVVLVALAAVVLVVMFVLLLLSARAAGVYRRAESEKTFLTHDGRVIPVPEPTEAASIDLSLVVPAYKETERLPIMLAATLEYLSARKHKNPSFTYEIIIVDDGSPDDTAKVALGYSQEHGYDKIRVLKLAYNRGKGGAVRMGMLSARGRRMLMVDADGATEISDLDRLEEQLAKLKTTESLGGVAIGSRAHMENDEAVASRSFFRNLLMHGFHMLVQVMCIRGIRDSQCGFKLFDRNAAHTLFFALHIERWAFDVELIYLCLQLGIPVAEVPVNWHEVDGSKLSPAVAALQMARDIFRIRCLYMFGLWKVAPAR